MQVPALSADLPQAGKAILRGVVDGDLMLLECAVDGEEVVEVDEGLAEVDLIVDDYRLLGLLLLEDEGLYSLLWIYYRLEHKVNFSDCYYKL